MAAIEEPEAPEAEARPGERVARTDRDRSCSWVGSDERDRWTAEVELRQTYVVMPVVTRPLRRLLRRTPGGW